MAATTASAWLSRFRIMTWLPGGRAATAGMIALMAVWSGIACAAENPEIAKRRAAERKSFSDAEIVEGFFKITFGAELHTRGRVDRVRKYDAPVRVYIDNRGRPDRHANVLAAVEDIRSRIRSLDVSVTDKRDQANVFVTLVRDRDLSRTIREIYGRENARRIQNSLDPQCLSSFRKDDNFRIQRSDVILAVDVGAFVFADCLYEELLQALGPINDDPTVPWSMFNDNVHLGFFGIYDQYILNILYHPRIRPGMTRDEVTAALPEILPEVRAWVAKINNLPD